METLTNLESFVRSAAYGSFSEAARRLAVTPAAVSRNVAMLERNLGVRLFHRSTRKLTLTEAGDALHLAIAGNLEGIQAAIASLAIAGAPTGTLKVSMAPTFGTMHLLPLLPASHGIKIATRAGAAETIICDPYSFFSSRDAAAGAMRQNYSHATHESLIY
jgi:DNA-binding transcriptional LysR family regulator